jgi:nitrate/nitrite transporter NarK
VIGTCLAYLLWCARNYLVFGAFAFSTVPGVNLLHWNAAGMRPFLDNTAAQEVSEALAAYPTIVQRHYESDQFSVAAEQVHAGLSLLKKYPLAFFFSHVVGSFRAFSVFEPMVLKNHFGTLLVYLISLAQLGLTAGGLIGVARGWKSCDAKSRLVLAAMLVAGIVSVLSAGVVASPRFRFPLEIPLAIGWAQLIRGRGQFVT